MQTHIIITSDYSRVHRELVSRGAVPQGQFLRLHRKTDIPPAGFYAESANEPIPWNAPVATETNDMRVYPLWIMDLLGGSAYETAKKLDADCVILHRVNRAHLTEALPASIQRVVEDRIIHLAKGEQRRLIGGTL